MEGQDYDAPGAADPQRAASVEEFAQVVDRIRGALDRVIVGQSEVVEQVLTALISGGHVLIEGVPGLGKTMLARAVSRVLDCKFGRIQFTPDLMPSDITGGHVFNMKTREFDFHPGPVFTNLLLADEINRAPAKTHAALLEVMQEHRVTVDRTTFELEPPFFTLATQNPIESEGTYALPAAQLDRFMFKVVMAYLPEEHEENLLTRRITPGEAPESALEGLEPPGGQVDPGALERAERGSARRAAHRALRQPARARHAHVARDLSGRIHPRRFGASSRAAVCARSFRGAISSSPKTCKRSFTRRCAIASFSRLKPRWRARDVDIVLTQIRDSVEVPRSQ